MKKLTILFILCFTTFSYGQIGKYNILFEGSRRQDCCARHECQNWYDIKAHFSDSSFIWVAEHITFAADSQNYIIDHEVQFNANKSISSLSAKIVV